jgi:hypothetical protein
LTEVSTNIIPKLNTWSQLFSNLISSTNIESTTVTSGKMHVTILTLKKAIKSSIKSKYNEECDKINSTLGGAWLGCLWGTPSAPYSCVCPDVNTRYEAYIKHRLNVASFWNTPVETPVKRAEFVDALQYGRKVNITVAGDFNLKVGQVMFVRLNGISQYPSKENSVLNGLYYIMGIKHVFTSSGTHETGLSLSRIAPDYSDFDNGGPYYP